MKRIITTITLIFILSFNTFSAVVSDNDGSAFITKSEFDALKNNFNTQIKNYNQSIDNKIDGAIASYLSGIRVSNEIDNYVSRLITDTANGFRFINRNPEPGKNTITTERNVIINFDIYKQVPIVYPLLRSINNASSTGIYYDIYATVTQRNKIDNIYNLFGNANSGTPGGHLGNSWTTAYWVSLSEVESKKENRSSSTTKNLSVGDGEVWEYYKNANGTIKLTSYNKTYYPLQNITYDIHLWHKYWTKGDTDKDGLKNYLGTERGGDVTLTSGKETISIDSKDTWGIYTFGDAKEPSTSETDSFGGSHQLSKTQSKGIEDWELLQFADKTNQSIYCINQNQNLTVDTTQSTETLTGLTFNEPYYKPDGGNGARDAKISDITVNYYKVSYTPESKKVNEFSNDILTSLAGEVVHLGGGIPMCNVPEESKVKFTFNFVLEDKDHVVKSGDIGVKISNKQFVDGDFATGTGVKKYKDENVSLTTGDNEVTYTFDSAAKQTFWINILPPTNGDMAYIKSLIVEYTN